MTLLYALSFLALAAQGEANGGRSSTLAGMIGDEQGRPITGANVFIWTATPGKGLGVL
jgi:protocatechuate 3,4-dioxygenase beta subunit